MNSGETSALREAIDLAVRIIRCAEEIVRERPYITRSELIELLSEMFIDDVLVDRGARIKEDRMKEFLLWLRTFLRKTDPVAWTKIVIAIKGVAAAKTPTERKRAVARLIKAIAELF